MLRLLSLAILGLAAMAALAATHSAEAVESPFGGEEFYEGSFGDAKVADFDRDGWPDVLAIEAAGITIWLNDRTGRLSRQRSFDVGPVSSIAPADLDGDGWQDIVFTTQRAEGNEVGVIMARKKSFDPPGYLPVGLVPGAVAVGDLNGDVKPDLVIASVSREAGESRLYAYLGRGSGKFGPRLDAWQSPPCHENCGSQLTLSRLQLADLNGDSRLDALLAPIAAFSPNAGVHVLPGLGDGRFGPHHQVGTWQMAAAPGDFDGDGWTDIAATRGDWIAIFWNAGSGGFDFSQSDTLRDVPASGEAGRPGEAEGRSGGEVAALHPYLSILASDMNGDGRVDVLAGEFSGMVTRLVWHFNRGGRQIDVAPAAHIKRPMWSSDWALACAAADLDRDGSADVISLRRAPYPHDGTWVLGVLRHARPEAFRAMSELPIPAMPELPDDLRGRFLPVTLEANGRLEMVQPLLDGLLHWTFDEQGRLQSPREIHVEGRLTEVADLSGDGRTDLLMARGGDLEIVHMGPTGPVRVDRWSDAVFMRLGRFDDPPAMDILIRDAAGAPSILLNDGTGQFVRHPAQIDETAQRLTESGAGDLDGDGRDELVVQHRSTSEEDTVVTYTNLGAGRFQRSQILTTPPMHTSRGEILVTDLDGNRSPEILVLEKASGAGGQLWILNLVLGTQIGFGTWENTSSLTIADFDLDGRPDVAFESDVDSNDGNLTLILDPVSEQPVIEHRNVQGAWYANSVVTGDADGNGTIDVVVGVESWEGETGASILFNTLSPMSGGAVLSATPASVRPTLDLSPNPSRGDATLRFAVSAPGPVRVELFDLAGRRVHHETVTLEAGAQSLRLMPPRHLPTGVYLVRAATARESAVTRLAIMR